MADWPEGYARHVFDTLDSTLSEAARMAPSLTGPAWIMAVEQTAARGRRGRTWSTPRGNFAATLIMRRSGSFANAALRSFVASLALREAFVEVTGQTSSFSLKWPNDVLLHGGKVAGILLESLDDFLVIGIGVNLAHAPHPDQVEQGAVTPVSVAAGAGISVAPEIFLDVLASSYARLEQQFSTYGFEPIRTQWLNHAARIGEVVTARTMRDETVGVFEDVDADGNLILNTPKGRVAITAADVYF
ncbi:biotin--[acetyl-CoA-carboxylase] ligase [Sulfitobacter sp. F26169L]|uniref:biotin--[acetyl-CoA-carboxylase] ligase n=1 Tax=Sulfitobacter sp. F26169L TaxID=2996015 RepID=UPI002260E064|nr:biotin--[acetyl-CoA-carboxylase] ligase [Sulfitobacter sp. F26169L]MCX7566237.1 biotin--[acetyl-CoA-carboxylase] ligase [Sulfitobacter sp. F26169L]